jgi:hypothetical protein
MYEMEINLVPDERHYAFPRKVDQILHAKGGVISHAKSDCAVGAR